jgi:outer membrane protein assembly factor BamD
VISNYPDSEWAPAAKFQIASSRAAVSRGSDYDQGATKEAKQKFEEFVQEHPDAVLSRQAEENIKNLKNQEAEGSYNIAAFYEKQKDYKSAEIYYNDVINTYPDTMWAAKAVARLEVMEKRKK